ncbi:hypothetical protein EKO04_002171 [Ascochyta lentis]|uniref:DUF7730 domain-containing protein n=1 Tax=Ascochyta lentis TaxID=205686 RepID=A0A8H7MG42_9PLEO|nr:hypothetical protein EKO04_002171 [Ascochyta lentis]
MREGDLTSRNQTHSPLLRLPPELRNQIYRYIFDGHEILIGRSHNAVFHKFIYWNRHQSENGVPMTPWNKTEHQRSIDSLLYTCRQTRHDTAPLLFGLNTISGSPAHLTRLLSFQREGIQHIRIIRVEVFAWIYNDRSDDTASRLNIDVYDLLILLRKLKVLNHVFLKVWNISHREGQDVEIVLEFRNTLRSPSPSLRILGSFALALPAVLFPSTDLFRISNLVLYTTHIPLKDMDLNQKHITRRDQTHSPILSLPAELRNKVYEYAVGGQNIRIECSPEGLRESNPSLFREAALRRTCRQIRNEVDPYMQFALNTFSGCLYCLFDPNNAAFPGRRHIRTVELEETEFADCAMKICELVMTGSFENVERIICFVYVHPDEGDRGAGALKAIRETLEKVGATSKLVQIVPKPL